MSYGVELSYIAPSGKRYSERTTLDLAMYVGTGGITRNGLHDIHKELKQIADTLKRWSDWDGLKVLTREDIRRRKWELEAEWAEEEAEAAAAVHDGQPIVQPSEAAKAVTDFSAQHRSA